MLDTSLIVMVVILALVFDFINGFHDTANAIATCVSTRAIRPGVAIVGTAILNFLGAMISTGVAKTIGGDIVISPTLVNEMIIIAGLVGAIIWNLLTWWVGMPSSSSHALIGGMILHFCLSFLLFSPLRPPGVIESQYRCVKLNAVDQDGARCQVKLNIVQ